MSKIKVAAFGVSLDGFGAGPRQDLNHPLGVGGKELLQRWLMPTAAFQRLHGSPGGSQGIDNDFAARSFENIGAWIIGRNMFGPVRGPWIDDSWKGWWGVNPPYHTPVFVLTHYPRAPLEMEGGTTFYFISDGPESALTQAKGAAHGKDVRIGGGVSLIRQYLLTNSIDELHLALSPVLLGEGEHLFSGINLPKLGLAVSDAVRGEEATHVVIKKS
jgi:dihydrofolate reductase